MADKNYVVVPLPEANLANMVADCIETSVDTLRKNNTDTKTILKYEGSKPASLGALVVMTYAEILVELQKAEWQSEE